MNSKHCYYAIFNYEEDGITITFPDLPGCISCGYSTVEALQMAKEALELYLEDIKKEDIPQSTILKEEMLKPTEKIFLIGL
ncbi:type II toxin-antitoxin system HicB family antitoxin [Paenibacillus sp. KS-LC4]|uniref:type II toxin-antitoxin system HicB family antitoxin n=1 Tax=Paenibacillus sp. KS-LC4 TaxID=2979727 RepID=UPI0030D54401